MKRIWQLIQPALTFGAIIFGVSLLMFEGVDILACILAAASFILLLVSDAGKYYFELTHQPQSTVLTFKTIVEPLMAFVLLESIFYVVSGSSSWFFLLASGFIGFILLIVNLSALMEVRGKAK